MKWIGYIVLGGAALYVVTILGFHLYVQNFIERPGFELVRQDGAIEIRDYPELVVAEVRKSGSRERAVNRGFGPLANYIFAKNREGGGIAMTAPVTQTRVRLDEPVAMTAPVTQQKSGQGAAGTWTIRFIMPSKYKLEDLPKPAGDVTLSTLAARRVVAIRFSGRASDGLIAENEAKLRSWAKGQDLVLSEKSPIYAYYNDPSTPGMLRRNEVLIDVAGGG